MTDGVYSAPKGRSIPDGAGGEVEGHTAWVVLGSSGQWSDWSQWVVCVYQDEQTAKDMVGSITSAVREILSEEPSEAYGEDDEHTPEYKTWLERLAAADPQADQYDQPHYTAQEVPFYPSTAGDEGRQAEVNSK